jgi:hypothetical protein
MRTEEPVNVTRRGGLEAGNVNPCAASPAVSK